MNVIMPFIIHSYKVRLKAQLSVIYYWYHCDYNNILSMKSIILPSISRAHKLKSPQGPAGNVSVDLSNEV